MILNVGWFDFVEDVHDDMVNGECGTNTTLFLKAQTGVIDGIGSTDITLLDKSFSAGTINVTYLLITSLANGNDVTEYEVNDGSGTAYNRVLQALFGKTDEFELNMLHTFEFQVVI